MWCSKVVLKCVKNKNLKKVMDKIINMYVKNPRWTQYLISVNMMRNAALAVCHDGIHLAETPQKLARLQS